jgi:hypothetical protein
LIKVLASRLVYLRLTHAVVGEVRAVEVRGVGFGEFAAELLNPLVGCENLPANPDVLEANSSAVTTEHAFAGPTPSSTRRGSTRQTIGGFGKRQILASLR